MTRLPILIIICCMAISVFGQDIIVKTDGVKIEAKVTEVNPSDIKYTLYSRQAGPIYTIPVSSISKILYEDGYIEDYPSSTNDVARSSMGLGNNINNQFSDEDLIRYAGISYSEKAIKYKKIAWIGGSCIFGACAILGIALGSSTGWTEGEVYAIPIGVGFIGGAVWTGSWLIASNRLNNRVPNSYSILHQDFGNPNGCHLSASINVIGNSLYKAYSLGPSLSYTF